MLKFATNDTLYVKTNLISSESVSLHSKYIYFTFSYSKIVNFSFNEQIIAASVRHRNHVTRVAMAGAHIATIPYSVIEQLVKHPLTEQGIEKFATDWEKAVKN